MTSLSRRGHNFWGWLFIAPTMFGLIILNIIPGIQSIWQSFFKVGDFGRGNVFVGFQNYSLLISDNEIWQSLANTFAYTFIVVPFSIVFGIIFAIMLNREIKGRTVYRAIFFLPQVVAPAAIAMVWKWLYNERFGLINHMLGRFGISPVNWISSSDGAIMSIAIIAIWSALGYNLILFLAGLQEIPNDYYEAAEIDGASIIRQQFIVTIPLLSPTIYFVAVTGLIGAMQIFDLIFMITGSGNPAAPKTQSLVYIFYRYSFVESNRGYGSAIVVLLLLIIMVITIVLQRTQKKLVHYG